MFEFSCTPREREPEQKELRVGGCDRALAFDARGDRTAWQKGLRVRNSPTCTLSQNGYGDIRSAIIIQCNLVETRSGHGRVVFKGFSLGAAFPAMQKDATSMAYLPRCSEKPPVGIEPTTVRLRSACSTN